MQFSQINSCEDSRWHRVELSHDTACDGQLHNLSYGSPCQGSDRFFIYVNNIVYCGYTSNPGYCSCHLCIRQYTRSLVRFAHSPASLHSASRLCYCSALRASPFVYQLCHHILLCIFILVSLFLFCLRIASWYLLN